jgi:hypothetical protein
MGAGAVSVDMLDVAIFSKQCELRASGMSRWWPEFRISPVAVAAWLTVGPAEYWM